MFSENQFCSLSVLDLLRLIPWVFWSEIFTRTSSLCLLSVLVWYFYQTFVTVGIEFLLKFESQIRPTKLAINFLLIIVTTERKVRSCVKLFDFFCESILIRLTWNLSRFVPNSVDILTWNFKKKYFGRIFQKFSLKPRLSLPKLVKFCPTFCNFYFASILRWKNSHKYFHMFFAPR